jgi:primosomal protein N' (replication factor Y) (superfamily II helicase)
VAGPLVVRVLPDVPAIGREFDYAVPDALADEVRVGTVVRVPLHGRRVRAWVVALDVEPPPGVRLQAVAKVTGWGPTPELIDLARWASWRWAGRTASLLRTATPDPAVRALPPAPRRPPAATGVRVRVVEQALDGPGPAVLRLAPGADLLIVVQAAAARGNALVLCPTADVARAMASRLRRAGTPVALAPRDWALGAAGATVVGTRAAVWAPVTDLAAVVVLDEHDEAHQQEQAPTWHARDVALERAARAGVPCVLTSPCPTLDALAGTTALSSSRTAERSGWPPVLVADRREEDPLRAGLFSPALLRAIRGGGRALCVLNRTGRARLLACTACGELARCDACHAAVEQPSEDVLRCRRCATERPPVCLGCGGTRLRYVRAGISRVREDLEALLGEPVAELAAGDDPGQADRARVVVGTEAVLRHVPRAEVVAFLDLDQELTAPRYRAAEQALALVALGARVAAASGPGHAGRAGGTVVLQTRIPDHEVVEAAVHADPTYVQRAEAERRSMLRFPPETALAAVSGAGAPAFVEAMGAPIGVELLGPADGRWLVRAPDHRTLCDALAATPRPAERTRVEVDPLRV